MIPKFKITGSSLIVLCFLGMAFLLQGISLISDASSSTIISVDQYRSQTLPLTLLGYVQLGLIILIGFIIFRLIQKINQQVPWNDRYYRSIKNIAWLSLAVMFIRSYIEAATEFYISKNIPFMEQLQDSGLLTDTLLKTLFSSPVSWLLVFCIFLIPDLLQFVNGHRKQATSPGQSF